MCRSVHVANPMVIQEIIKVVSNKGRTMVNQRHTPTDVCPRFSISPQGLINSSFEVERLTQGWIVWLCWHCHSRRGIYGYLRRSLVRVIQDSIRYQDSDCTDMLACCMSHSLSYRRQVLSSESSLGISVRSHPKQNESRIFSAFVAP